MPRFVRLLGVVLFFSAIFVPKDVFAQCNGLPSIQILASSKIPQGLCAPVQASFTYNVKFFTAVPTGTLELVIDWGDGSALQVIPQTANGAVNDYNASPSHNFPLNSDCEFLVVMTMRYNGVLCLNTRQQQKIASWRTDEFNGGNVQLISPVTNNNEHLVCYGQPINVVFNDETEFNCAANYTHLGSVIETPNDQTRWQQIIYNTPIGGSKIPNVTVNGSLLTGAAGADLITNYTPQAVRVLAYPVVINDARRRNTLPITAPGGFGAGFPQVGDVFEVTIRYWNYCNPYTNNPDPTKPPVSGDLLNGDNAPVERIATIRIVDSPPVPTGSNQTVCNGVTPSDFSMTIPGGGNNIVNWYRDNGGTPGALITSGPSTTLPITSHPNWVSNTTAGTYSVWASYQPNVVGPSACESQKVLVTRIIREALTVPDPVPAFPTEVCNGTAASPVNITLNLPAPGNGTPGGPTEYNFFGGGGLTLQTGITANPATYNVNVGFAAGTLFVDRTNNIRVERHYTPGNACPVTRTFPIRIYNRPVGGTPTPIPDVCETTPLSTIVLNGYLGDIVRWEVNKNNTGYNTYAGTASGATISPGMPGPGVYQYRAVVKNGPCAEVFSSVVTVTVSTSPVGSISVGADQFLCNPSPFESAAMGGSSPGVGTGTWTYVGSFPVGLPAPIISDIHNGNAKITPASTSDVGAYTMRWTIANGNCALSKDVIIDFGSTPTTSNAGVPQNICGETTQLGANTPTIGFGSWTILSNPSGAGDPGAGVIVIADPTSPTSDLTLTGPAFRYGTYVLQWQIKSGSCPVSLSTVNITFNRPATVTASDVGPVCIGPTSFSPINLSGTIGGGATGGQWVNVNGGGTVSASTVTTVSGTTTVTATYTPVQADYDAGTPIRVKLVANANAPCSAVEQEILINIDRTPLANAGTNINNICGDAVQLQAENPPPFGATGQWTTIQAGVTFDNPTSPTTFVRGLPASPLPNTTVVTWTLKSASGLCPSAPASINLTRVAPPTASSQSIEVCEAIPAGAPVVANILLTDYQAAIIAAAGGTSATWYKNSTPETSGTLVNPAATQTNIADGQIYIARITGGSGCTADVTVTIRVKPLPPALIKDVALCEDAIGTNTASGVDLSNPSYTTDITGGATGVAVDWYDSQADAIAEANKITAPFDVTGSRTVYGRVRYSSGLACFDIGQLNLIVKSLPASATIFGRSNVCVGDPSTTLPTELYQVTPITGAKYHWTIPSNFQVFGGGTINDFLVLLQFPSVVNTPGVAIKLQMEINGCLGPVLEKIIIVNSAPSIPDVQGEWVVCENDNGIQYLINPLTTNYPSSSYNWELRRASDNALGGAFVADGQTTDRVLINFEDEDVVLTVRESNSVCASPLFTKNITINRRPVIANTDVDVCSGLPNNVVFQPTAASPVPIDKYNVAVGPIGTLNPISGPTSGVGMAANAIAGDTYENLSAVFMQVNYTVQPISVGATGKECPGAPEIITLNIKPEPQLSPSLFAEICSGEATNIVLVSAGNTFPADSFNIQSITPAPLPANVTALTPLPNDPTKNVGAFAIRDNKWENTSGVNQTIQYHVRPYSSILKCYGDPPTTVDVLIHPKSVVDQVTLAPICSGTPINVAFTSAMNPPPTGPDFLWSVRAFDPNIAITGPVSGTGDIVGMIATNTSLTADGTITFDVQARNNSATYMEGDCLGPVMTFTVTILKAPAANAQILEACSDAVSGTSATVNLKNLETSVTSDPVPADNTITWYNAPAPFSAATQIPTANLAAYTVQNGIPVYAVVKYTTTGCTNAVPVRYTVNPGLKFDLTVNDVACAGKNDGEINVNVTGGTPSFQFSINSEPYITVPTGNSFAFKQLVGGVDYTIDVKDSKGCTAPTQIKRVNSPLLLQATAALTNVTCFLGTDGQIKITATGGTPNNGPYTEYRILQTGFVDPNNDGVFPNLPFGTYTVRVTDANGCTVDVQADLTQPTQVNIVTLEALADELGNNLSCRYSRDASVKVAVEGGIPDVTTGFDRYHFVVRHNNADTTRYNIDAVLTPTQEFNATNGHPIGAGTYTVQAFDARNCPSRPQIVVINNPPPFDPGVIGTSFSMCFGGTPQPITQLAAPSGGTGKYEVTWEVEYSTNPAAGFQPTQHAGAADGGYVLTPGEVADPATYTFHRIVKTVTTLPNATGCPSLGADRNVVVTVNKTYDAYIDARENVCEGESVDITIYLTGLPPGNSVFLADYKNNSETVHDFRGIQLSPNAFGTAIKTVPNFSADDTYTLLSVKDPNGCPANITTDHKDIHVIKTPVALSVLDDVQCSDQPFQFNWTPDPAISYILDFGDNSAVKTYPAGSTTNQEIHTYDRVTNGDKQYTAVLTAQNGTCAPRTSLVQVTLERSIKLNLVKNDPVLCGGGQTSFNDQSEGVDQVHWYYRVVGTTTPFEDYQGAQQSLMKYTLNNMTSDDPIIYEFVYEATNSKGCTANDVLGPVKVYRNVNADFEYGDLPDLVAGVSQVTFTNKSTPENAGAGITYEWDFGDDRADPPTVDGWGPSYAVKYPSEGDKIVSLKVTNTNSAVDGAPCESKKVAKIHINRPPLNASFTVTPLAACFPTEIVAVNTSPGADIFAWSLYNNGGLVSTSTLVNPTFTIQSPGTYTIKMTAGYHLSPGQSQDAPDKTVQVFAKPIAAFDFRPNPVYVPDTELSAFNLSKNADNFTWDFDDGFVTNDVSPKHTYKLEGHYTITLIANKGYGSWDVDGNGTLDGDIVCYDTTSQSVNAVHGGQIKIPNAFTPNPSGSTGGTGNPGSGSFNDVFLPISSGVEEFTMQIFDRWGTLVFESKDKNIGWDGYDRNNRLMPAGVYVYRLVLLLSNGQRTTKIGDVTLIR